MRSILITGANGFIGVALSKKMLELGCKVIKLPRELLYEPMELKNFVHIVKPSQIFHLAAYGNRYDQIGADMIVRANILGTFNLLEATRQLEYEAFVNTGSSSEYGNKVKPMKETDNLDPNTLYGVSKVATTFIARYYAETYDKPIVTIRPFSVTGIGDQDSHLIPTIIRSCLFGEKMKFVAHSVHDFIDIDDFINGVLLTAKNAKILAGDVINIGTAKQYSNQEVKDIVEHEIRNKANIEEINQLRTYDTKNMWQADNSRLTGLGWVQTKDLRKIISEMVKYQSLKTKNENQ